LLHCKPKCSYAKGERWSIVFFKNERAANGIQVFTDAENISSVMLKKTCQKITRANANRHSSSSFGLAASVALRRLFANCILPEVSFSFCVRKLVFANFRWGATPFRLSLKIIISLFQLRISKSSDEHNKIWPKCIATETGRVGRSAEVWS